MTSTNEKQTIKAQFKPEPIEQVAIRYMTIYEANLMRTNRRQQVSGAEVIQENTVLAIGAL